MAAKTERLLNLVVALLHARRPLTFAELRQRLGEWQDGDAESMRRKFERDKDELRRLGVPVETVTTDALGGESAYWLDEERYAQPDLALDVEQVTALAVALQLVDGGPAPLAWSKLSARAPDPRAVVVPEGVRVVLGPGTTPAPLAEAVVSRRAVRFSYRTSRGEVATRTVDPAAVVTRAGSTYLVGRDHDRDDLRAFRTDRMLGVVEMLDQPAGPVPEDLDLAALVTGPDEPLVTAEVVEHPDGTGPVERTDAPGRLLAGVLRASPQEELIAPAELRDEIAAALRAVLAAHGADA